MFFFVAKNYFREQSCENEKAKKIIVLHKKYLDLILEIRHVIYESQRKIEDIPTK